MTSCCAVVLPGDLIKALKDRPRPARWTPRGFVFCFFPPLFIFAAQFELRNAGLGREAAPPWIMERCLDDDVGSSLSRPKSGCLSFLKRCFLRPLCVKANENTLVQLAVLPLHSTTGKHLLCRVCWFVSSLKVARKATFFYLYLLSFFENTIFWWIWMIFLFSKAFKLVPCMMLGLSPVGFWGFGWVDNRKLRR